MELTMLMSLHCRRNNQRGIGLLELMLSISIIAILLVMATRFYMSAKQSQQITDTVSQVDGIISAAANYANGNNSDYSDMSLLVLVQGGYLPPIYCGGDQSSCPGLNPFRGTTAVTGTTTNYTINMGSIPTNICPSIAGMVNAAIKNTQIGSSNISSAGCSGSSLQVTVY
jgi:type II secretory pathway pseudopilin PulG